MRITLLILNLFLFSSLLHGQNRIIEGKVLAGSYFRPINKVHVRSGVRSTKTDRHGMFTLLLTDGEPLLLSHIKYDNQEINVGRLLELTDFTFYLTPTSKSSSEVLQENPSQEIYAQKFEHVFDYTFVADTLIVLSYMHEENMKTRSYINCALTGLKYGEVFQRLVLPNNIRNLKDHPSGSLYLSGPEGAIRLNRQLDKLDYIQMSYYDYVAGIDPVYAKKDDLLYYAKRISVLPRLSHYLYDLGTKSSGLIRTIENRKYFEKVNDDYVMLNAAEYILANELALETGLEAALFAPYLRSYYTLREVKTPYAPGFIVDNHLLILDHTNQWMFKHSLAGHPIDSIGIYHDDLIKEELVGVIQDPSSEQLYLEHERGGVHYIRELDIKTGASGRPYQLNKPFAAKVKVFEGYVYYLHQSPIDSKTWHLLRERLPFTD